MGHKIKQKKKNVDQAFSLMSIINTGSKPQ